MSNIFTDTTEETSNFADTVNWEVVRTNSRVLEVAKLLSKEKMLAVDTENAGLDPQRKIALLLQIGTTEKCYIFEHYLGLDLSPIKAVLEDESILNVLFNAKYDWKWLKYHYNISMNNIFCCQVTERVLTVGLPGAKILYSLLDVVKKYLGIALQKEARSAFINRDPILDPITDAEFAYSAADVVLLPDICLLQIDKLNTAELQIAAQLEFDVLPPISKSELEGIQINQDRWRNNLATAKKEYDRLSPLIMKCFDNVVSQKTLFAIPTFKLSSNQQLLSNLSKLGYDLDNTEADTLRDHSKEHKVFRLLLPWRGYSRVLSTYGEKLLKRINPQTGRLHCQFNQVRASTGRMSAEKPALQTIPGYDPDDPTSLDFRSCFVSRPGYKLVTADFSQQELRILADMSGDPTFSKAYTELDADGETLDVHKHTASVIFGVPYEDVTKVQRGKAKCVHPDTLLSTPDGYGTIGTLVDFSKVEDTFVPVSSDVKVLSPSSRFISVNQAYNGGKKKLLNVTSRNGVVVCSEEHLFKLKSGKLVRAAELQERDVLADPVYAPMLDSSYRELSAKLHRDIPEVGLHLSHDLAYFAGVFLGNGSASRDHAEICIGNTDTIAEDGMTHFLDWFNSLFKTCSDLGLRPRLSNSKELVHIGSRGVMGFLRALCLVKTDEEYLSGKETHVYSEGKYSCRKLRVPSWVIDAGRESFLHLLGGMIDTDGWVGKREGNIGLCSKDPVFIGQLCVLANSCGVRTTVESTFNKTYQRYYWKLRFSKSNNDILSKYIRHPRKRNLIQFSKYPQPKLKENHVLSVTSHSQEPSLCVDLNVDSQDHLYVTNGIVTHNTLNFFLVYGGGVKSLAYKLDIDEKGAEQLINDYFDRYSSIKNLLDSFGASALNKGFIRTISGRRRYMFMPPELTHGSKEFKKERASIRRRAGNTPIQGSGADVTKKAIVFVDKRLQREKFDAKILLVVHDELVVEVRDDQAEQVARVVEEEMIRAFAHFFINIPMAVDAHVGPTWEK